LNDTVEGHTKFGTTQRVTGLQRAVWKADELQLLNILYVNKVAVLFF